jgi:hypothetical protein
MSPIIRAMIDRKVAAIDGLLETISVKIIQGDTSAAREALEKLRKEIADVKRQLLS